VASVRERAAASPEARFDAVPRHVYDCCPILPPPALAPAAPRVLGSLNAAMRQLLSGSDRVMLLGEDLHDPYGGAFKVTTKLSTDFGSQVVSSPISEAGIVGSSIGLALSGFRPIAEITTTSSPSARS
jgi:2-oxoisovalerate dehydrogenase E1 component